jgi:hypothetical protein
LSPIRVAGSVVSLINGAWAIFFSLYAPQRATLCALPCVTAPASAAGPIGPFHTSVSEVQLVLLALGAVLAIDSLVSFAGLRVSFILGAVLSAAVLLIQVAEWGTFSTDDATVAVVVSALALLADAVASRPSRGLSEKDSPLNLPVFG